MRSSNFISTGIEQQSDRHPLVHRQLAEHRGAVVKTIGDEVFSLRNGTSPGGVVATGKAAATSVAPAIERFRLQPGAADAALMLGGEGVEGGQHERPGI